MGVPLQDVHVLEKDVNKGDEQQQQKEKDLRERFRVRNDPGIMSRLLFHFVEPIVRLGRCVRLEEQDLIRRPDMVTSKLHEKFQQAWEEEKVKPKPRILRALVAGNWGKIFLTGLLYSVTIVLQFVGPLMLNRIVAGLTCREGDNPEGCPTKRELYEFASVLFVAPLLQALAESHLFFQLNIFGTKLRNGLMAAIYRKCLKASATSLSDTSVGKIVTLMSTDAQKVQDAALSIHALWGAPIIIVVVLVLLYRYVEWATFVGLAVMFSLGPMTGKLAGVIGRFQRQRVGWVDKRVGVVNEVITGIRVIKFYAWENSFISRIQNYRDEEGKLLKKLAGVYGGFAVLLLVGPVFVAIACFSSYALAGNVISTADAYTALAFFTVLRMPLSFLPMFISSAINALVGLKRIQGFLLKPEAESIHVDNDVEKGLVEVRDGEFRWDLSSPIPTLSDISFTASPGSLTMIIGSVGSGKSTMLSALIREVDRVQGSVRVGGSVAYVAQSAWIINATVKENILMGKPFDEEKYNAAIEASQLVVDMGVWQNGDMTEIGERGITLSGGQKQRVSIARAVYADADVYILDDPLSAVDAHVGRHLFNDCLAGILAGKTIILVTNAVHYLPHADNIIWMQGGKIKASGTYKQMLHAGFDATYLDSTSLEEAGSRGSLGKVNSIPEGEEYEEDSAAGTPSEGDNNCSTGSSSPKVLAVSDVNVIADGMDAEQESGAARACWDESGPDAADKEENVKAMPAKAVEHKQKGQELTGVEERAGGAVSGAVVGTYLMAFGGTLAVLGVSLLLILEQGFKIGTDRWVGLWAEDRIGASLETYISVYASLGVIYGAFVFLRSIKLAFNHVRAGLTLHRRLLVHLLRLPMKFYDANPSGRIVNRFSRDMDIIDGTLLQSLTQFLGCLGMFLGILFVISMATPFFIPFLVPLSLLYFLIQRVYIPSGRELQRLESITRSPIYSKFGETINGVATIRAYNLAGHFTELSDEAIEKNGAAFTTQKAANGWLSTRLDFIGLTVLMLAGVLAVQGSIEPALAGLSLVYALDLTKFLKFGTQTFSRMESDFNSVERVVQYLEPSIEGNEDVEDGKVPEKAVPEGWPAEGRIKVNGISMRYREDTPLVLKKVSLDIQAGEKIGIAGRTGSGKSSLFLVFFRMVEPEEGFIEVDGVKSSELKLSTLRSKMSMIPQDPFMFSGTIRLNLDPFDEYQDDEIWKALEGVSLKEVIEAFPEKLMAPVVDNGGNFSQGQRQLFCLARALLRKSKILMMDEATASVDVETDALIQRTIRENMKDTTVLTIAHRINTIMDSDRVLVMDDGEVGEFDTPEALLKNDQSLYSKLVRDSQEGHRVLLGQSTIKIASRSTDDSGNEEAVDDACSAAPLQKSASTVGITSSTVQMTLDGSEEL